VADSAKINVLDDNPDVDASDLMDTSWSGPSSSRKRDTKPSLCKDSKFSKSTESLMDTSNRYDALSDEEEVERPPPMVLSAPPPNKSQEKRYELHRPLLSKQNVSECRPSKINGNSPVRGIFETLRRTHQVDSIADSQNSAGSPGSSQ
jgi:hypothetical protein